MAIKYVLALLFICCTVSFTSGTVTTVNGRIKMLVGTTAGCRDVITFMANLGPVYRDYRRYIDIEFVPWGRTRVENGRLICQFGERDCWANRLHRCSLHLLRGRQDAQVNYMICEFTRPMAAFELGSYSCATRAGLTLRNVENCMATTTGTALERPAQQASARPMQVINFVPFIVFNDNINRDTSTQARQRLRALICNALLRDPTTSVRRC